MTPVKCRVLSPLEALFIPLAEAVHGRCIDDLTEVLFKFIPTPQLTRVPLSPGGVIESREF